MYIKEIKLKNFRNYNEEKIELNEKTNIIYGDNAQGKTNIIEAIYLSISVSKITWIPENIAMISRYVSKNPGFILSILMIPFPFLPHK